MIKNNNAHKFTTLKGGKINIMFENQFQIEVDEITKRRFNEIETIFIFEELKNLHNHQTAIKMMKLFLDIPYDLEEDFHNLIEYTRSHPTKREIVIYYRANNISYQTINVHHGISHITISKYQKQFIQNTHTIFPKAPLLHNYNAFRLLPNLKTTLKTITDKVKIK